MYLETITLFNRKRNRSGDVWYPTVLENINLNIDKASITQRYGAESQDKAILNIKYQSINGNKVVKNKIWLPKKEWDKQENTSAYITFSDGQYFDFFCIGDYKESLINDNDYDDGFYNYINASRDGVFAITSVSGPYSVIKHFEITGK